MESNRPYWWQFIFLSIGYIAWTACRIGFPVGLSAMGKQFAWTSFEIGVLSTVFLVGQAAIDIPAGFWADRLDRKNLVCTGLLGIGFFTLLVTLSGGFWSALVARVLFGVMEGIYNIAAFSVAGSILPASRAFVNGLTQVFYGIGNFGGQTLVGSLLSKYPGQWQIPLYWLGGLTMAYGFIAFALFKRKYLRRFETHNEMMQHGFWETAKVVVSKPRVWRAVAIHACNVTASWGILGMGNYVFIEFRHFDPAFSARVFAIGYGVGCLFVPLGTLWADRFGRRPVVCAFGVWTAVCTFLLFNVAPPNWIMIAVCVGVAFGINSLYTLGYTLTQDAIAVNSMSGIGIATGVAGGIGYLFSMLGGPLVGFFIPLLGPLWAMNLVVTGSEILVFIFALSFLRAEPLPRVAALEAAV